MIHMLPIDELFPHPNNPRKNLGDLSELTASIKESGIFQNLTVVEGNVLTAEEDKDKKWGDRGFTVIIGHRRLAAAKLAGLTELPCAIVDMTNEEQLATMMLENMQRADLTAYEQAEGFRQLSMFGLSVAEMARKTGLAETTVRHRMKMAELNPEALQKAVGHNVTITELIALEKIKDIETRNTILQKAGTSSFDKDLEYALYRQEQTEDMELICKWFKDNGILVKPLADRIELYPKYSHYEKHIDSCCLKGKAKKITIELAQDKEYIFFMSKTGTDGYLYSLVELQEEDFDRASASAAAAAARADDAQRQLVELRAAGARAFNARRDFVTSLAANKKSTEEQGKMQAYTWHLLQWMASDNRDFAVLNDWLYQTQKINATAEIDPDAADATEQYFNRIRQSIIDYPDTAAAVVIYTFLGDYSGRDYFTTEYCHGNRCVVHTTNRKLDVIYEFLRELGYRMSGEECQLQDGTHPLYYTEE